MTRTQECRAQLAWIETNCPLDRTSIIPIKKAAEFCDKHVEISTMSTDAIQPLVKVKDTNVQDAVVASLKTMIDAGKKPTRKEVERVINITTTAPHREELIKRGKESDADPEGIKLYCGDFLTDYIKIPAGSIDCIITDPPYVQEWLHNYEAFAKAAVHVLKPGGFLITYIGHIHMDKILAQMTPHIDYFWIMCLKHAGHRAAVHGRMVQCTMKPILVFQKPPATAPKRYFNDLIEGAGKEKDLHLWEQGEEELRQIFEPFTDPGDKVLDPFCGSGTVLSMAKKMSRRAIGFDIIPENVAITKGRCAS